MLRYCPPGSTCQVSVAGSGAAVRVEMVNPVAAHQPVNPDSTGNGLRGLRERALLTGAQFRAGRLGDEWRVQAVVPTVIDTDD